MTTDFDDNSDFPEDAADIPESDALDSAETSADADSDQDDLEGASTDNAAASVPADSGLSLTGMLTMAGIAVLAFSISMNASLMIWPPTKIVIREVNGGGTIEGAVAVDASITAAARRARFSDGDDFLREGNYGQAIRRYLEVGTDQSSNMPLRLQYRLGLCNEELGLFDEALNYYRQMINRNVKPRQQWLSRVSQARVWLRMGDPRQCRQILAGSVLEAELDDVASHPVAAESLYLFALASARLETADEDPDPGEPWVVPSPSHWPVASVMTWADAKPKVNSPRGERTIVVVPEPDESQPLLKRVSLTGKGVTVLSQLEQVGSETGQPVTLTPEAQEAVKDHVVNANTSKIPASILLTALTEPYELTWTPVGNTIVVSPVPSKDANPTNADEGVEEVKDETVTQPEGRIARESLATALAVYPGHRLSTAARLEYGNVHYKDGDLPNAALYYQDLVSPSSDPQTMSAAFNLGLTHRQLGNLKPARDNLFLVVDGIPEHPLSAVASYLVGRMLLGCDPSSPRFYAAVLRGIDT